ncbi:MAG: outer membrane lipoprotein carrier protein LolA [Deferribacteres bacterium]|nr:outer membrane lipoprotein carrier protein LolA [candidate division KSB1 bacterium]MCB9508698.1 outer membrane lipoprotein carrier protein LolA [Deferribacteres bacterium]
MSTKTKIILFGCAFVLGFAAFASAFAGDEVDEIVKKLREKYEKIETLQADFVQTSIWSLAGEQHQSEGKIYLAEKNKYRVETDPQLIITDGTIVWTFSKDREQVIIDELSKSKENPLPRDILLKYTKDSRAVLLGEIELGGTPCYQIKFQPKDENSFIVSTTVWVSKADWLAIQIEQEDLNENLTRYFLKNIVINSPLSDSLFSLKIPASVEVVDLR